MKLYSIIGETVVFGSNIVFSGLVTGKYWTARHFLGKCNKNDMGEIHSNEIN